MAFDNLADYLSELQDDRELVRITVTVDPVHEMTEIVDRVCKSRAGGPAVFFEDVKGHSIPLIANLLGSERRMFKALQVDSFDAMGERIISLISPAVPAGWLEGLKLVPQIAQMARLPPRLTASADCQQVVRIGRDVDLNEFPIPHFWPHDAGPTITYGQLCTEHLESGIRCVELTSLLVRERDSLAVMWDPHREGWRCFLEYQRRNQQMPLAVVVGGDPVLPIASMAPLPPNTDAYLFAGFLRGQSVDLAKCRSNELQVPAQAEIVIEGYIDTQAPLQPVGQIGAATGFYAPESELPIMHVTTVTHRSNPVFPALFYGRTPMEDFWLNKACERMFLPIVKLFVPEIVDYHMPRAGAFRNLLFVSIRKNYPQQARKVMHALWGLGRMMVAKMIVVVDSDINVHDEESVWLHVGMNVHPGRDTVFCEGPIDMLDHATPVRGMGHKLGIDATRKVAAEGHPRAWPDAMQTTEEIKRKVDRRWVEFGLDESDITRRPGYES